MITYVEFELVIKIIGTPKYKKNCIISYFSFEAES